MRFIIIASVDQGTKPRDHLDHGNVISLPEAAGSELCGPHRADQAGIVIHKISRPGFSCQIDIGFKPHIENMLEFRKGIDPCSLGYIHHIDVAGHLDPLCHRQVSVSPCVVAFDVVSSDRKLPLAVVALISRNASALDSCRHRKGLCHGARLVGIADAEIFPQRI